MKIFWYINSGRNIYFSLQFLDIFQVSAVLKMTTMRWQKFQIDSLQCVCSIVKKNCLWWIKQGPIFLTKQTTVVFHYTQKAKKRLTLNNFEASFVKKGRDIRVENSKVDKKWHLSLIQTNLKTPKFLTQMSSFHFLHFQLKWSTPKRLLTLEFST